MKKILTTVGVLLLAVSACSDFGRNNSMMTANSWACPKGSFLNIWMDGYPNKVKKYQAIGCKDASGHRHGFHITWKNYGVKKHEGNFENDIPNGEWSIYHDNGELDSRGFFVRGKKEGIWEYWDNTGMFLYYKKYSNGEFVQILNEKIENI